MAAGGDGYVGYQTLFDTVRNKVGANNLCLVGGLDYAYRLDFVNQDNNGFGVKGEGLVYCSHPYNKKGIDPNVVQQSPLFDKNFKGVLNKYPVMFTEFGCNLPETRKNGKWIADSPQYKHVNVNPNPDNPNDPKDSICWGENRTGCSRLL